MKESDWKIFNEIKKQALDKFCTKVLNDAHELILNQNESTHHRYGSLYGLIQDKDKLLAQTFNGLSRSKAWLQLLQIRSQGLADKALLSKLSDDFQAQTKPKM